MRKVAFIEWFDWVVAPAWFVGSGVYNKQL